MLRKVTLVGILAIVFASCSRKTQSNVTKTTADKNAVLTISFISYGAGIDYAQLLKLDSLIKGNKVCNVQVEKKNWGREGEIDYCFYSNDVKCLQNWKTLLQQELNFRDRVQLTENKKCGEGH